MSGEFRSCCNCIDGNIFIVDSGLTSYRPCPCTCHIITLEKVKAIRKDLNQRNWEYDSVGEYFKEIDWLIAEVDRLHDVHDHYLFELDRANKLYKTNEKLLETNKNLMRNIGRNETTAS